MKILHSGSFLLMFAAGALAVSCSDGDTSQSTGSVLTPGGAQGGTAGAAGGTTGGATTGGSLGAAGGTGSLGSLGSLPGGAGGTGAAGGTAGPGGAITSVMIENKPCEKKVRTAGKTIPDFMIVLDRSLSMRPNCAGFDALINPECAGIDCNAAPHMGSTVCGGTAMSPRDRWAPAVSALKSLTMMFETKVNFGLTIFPGDGGGGGNQCTPGMQRVPVGPMTAAGIAMALEATQPAGATPTATTLQNVLQQIQSKKTSPDEQLPPQFVLLVTDGAPTCNGNQFQPGSPQPHQQTIAAVDALAKAGVKTYVIGYDASVNAMLAAQLTEYAQHGGTNNFYAVQDGPGLVSKFTEITGVVADCNYALDKKPDDKKFVLVELDGQKLFLDDPNGWTITDNNVTIQGEACNTLRDGSRSHTLSVTVECVPQDLK